MLLLVLNATTAFVIKAPLERKSQGNQRSCESKKGEYWESQQGKKVQILKNLPGNYCLNCWTWTRIVTQMRDATESQCDMQQVQCAMEGLLLP